MGRFVDIQQKHFEIGPNLIDGFSSASSDSACIIDLCQKSKPWALCAPPLYTQKPTYSSAKVFSGLGGIWYIDPRLDTPTHWQGQVNSHYPRNERLSHFETGSTTRFRTVPGPVAGALPTQVDKKDSALFFFTPTQPVNMYINIYSMGFITSKALSWEQHADIDLNPFWLYLHILNNRSSSNLIKSTFNISPRWR